MMTKIVDYFFSPVSPWTYFGGPRFAAMTRKYGVTIRYKPCDFGKVFPASGGLPLAQRPKQRQAYRLFELERWRDFLGMPLNIHPKFFPTPAGLASCAIIAARQRGDDPGRLADALMRAVWVEDRDIADPATVSAIAGACGLDGAAILAAAESEAAKTEYDANSAEAIERQVFGAPTYIYAGIPYWGQDRLDFLERALAKG
jgi:2-hydroxychromene-2-carboxylate isomerase